MAKRAEIGGGQFPPPQKKSKIKKKAWNLEFPWMACPDLGSSVWSQELVRQALEHAICGNTLPCSPDWPFSCLSLPRSAISGMYPTPSFALFSDLMLSVTVCVPRRGQSTFVCMFKFYFQLSSFTLTIKVPTALWEPLPK